uniref:C2 domain-containing protein n=1 Tax=Panagrolaimus sp. PS1159 TaxID=55785 RepID=A0AC35FRS5_9BILA
MVNLGITRKILSNSMPQLNCGESTKSSSDGDDPSVHGLDPSLYVTGGSASSYSVTDVAPTTNGGSCAALNGTSETMTVSTSNSWPENEPRPKGLGLIHCTLQHFPVRKRLKVSILKIEGLAGELKPELEIQPFCKVILVPGKNFKQQISAVKRGRNAVFNQEFFFDNITTEELDSKTLQIEVFHQSTTKLQKDMEIGEICVPLKDLTQLHTKKEVRIVEELKFKTNAKKVGKISITTAIQNGVLTVGIIKVDDLPKWGIIGAPDVCVRVRIFQEGAKDSTQVKHSRVIKSTCSAVYKESIAFLIQAKPADLAKTQVTVSVHDTSRSATGDDIIGSVFLGPHSIDKSESEQWKNTIEHLGKEYKGSHNLKPPSINNHNPDVHVSETHSDSEE